MKGVVQGEGVVGRGYGVPKERPVMQLLRRRCCEGEQDGGNDFGEHQGDSALHDVDCEGNNA